jgi:ABC-type multidrug transport system fused ATPase/permease subunit
MVEALQLESLRLSHTDDDFGVSGQAERYTLTLRNLLFTTLDYAFQGPLIGIVLLGTWGYAHGLVTLGQITAAALYSQQMYGPIDHMIQILDRLQMALASSTRLLGIVQVPTDREVGEETPEGVKLLGDELYFAYREGHDVLHGVTLDLTPGDRRPVRPGQVDAGPLAGRHQRTAHGVGHGRRRGGDPAAAARAAYRGRARDPGAPRLRGVAARQHRAGKGRQ